MLRNLAASFWESLFKSTGSWPNEKDFLTLKPRFSSRVSCCSVQGILADFAFSAEDGDFDILFQRCCSLVSTILRSSSWAAIAICCRGLYFPSWNRIVPCHFVFSRHIWSNSARVFRSFDDGNTQVFVNKLIQSPFFNTFLARGIKKIFSRYVPCSITNLYFKSHLQRRHELPRNDSLLLLLAKASFLGVSFEAAIKEWILFA